MDLPVTGASLRRRLQVDVERAARAASDLLHGNAFAELDQRQALARLDVEHTLEKLGDCHCARTSPTRPSRERDTRPQCASHATGGGGALTRSVMMRLTQRWPVTGKWHCFRILCLPFWRLRR